MAGRLELAVLASGSSGNAVIVRDAETGRSLLVDCGICARAFFGRCDESGIDPSGIEAVLVTHAHTDHTSGLGVVLRGLARRGLKPPLYAHPLTRAASKPIAEVEDLVAHLEISHGEPFEVAGMSVTPFPTSHDSPGSTCFRFEADGDAVGCMTDTGFVTPEAHEALTGVRILAIESNHDVGMLEEGPYPPFLKRRILGAEGHLSNAQCREEVVSLLHPGLEHVVAMHISEHNNTFELPAAVLSEALAAHGHGACVHVALPDRPIAVS